MYSPVFLSCPTTSGSPLVLSISFSDHSFSVLASSFACTLAHSRPLWRFMFFSKRAFNAPSSSSRCSADKSFLLLLIFRALVALIVVASRVSYLLLRCAQFAVSTPFGVHPSVHPRSPPPGEYACVPSFPSRRESAGKSRATPPQTPPAAPAQASDFRTPACEASEANFPPPTRKVGNPAWEYSSTPPGPVQSCESLGRCRKMESVLAWAMTKRDLNVGEVDLLKRVYDRFNARDMETLLAAMHEDVIWANGMEGGHVHGRDEVRSYWTRQWTMIDPHVEPVAFVHGPEGEVVVEVHQLVRDLKGNLLADKVVGHVFRIENGLIKRFDIQSA